MASDTPEAGAARSELARLQRHRTWVRFAGSVGFVLLAVVGVIVAVTVQAAPVGIILVGMGITVRFVTVAFDAYLNLRIPKLTYESEGSQRWWYDRRSGDVEEGIMPRGGHRDGPYRTRDDALRAPEIARERAAAWNAEDD